MLWLLFSLYLVSVLYIGYRSRGQSNASDYFLASRSMPWWTVWLSIYATASSALTFVGIPGAAFSGNFHFMVLVGGGLFGRIVIARWFLPAFYKSRCYSIYQYIGTQIGPASWRGSAVLFLVTRFLASGVRLAACGLALSVFFKIPVELAILATALLATIYTMTGGLRAVIRTDIAQFALFATAALIALPAIISAAGGLEHVYTTASAAGKFSLGSLELAELFDLSSGKSILFTFLFGWLINMAAMGTDQDLVQRMLACRKPSDAGKALVASSLLEFPMFLLFLSIGASLFVFYNGQAPEGFKNDQVFPLFAQQSGSNFLFGIVLTGLLAAAMSSLDSALGALATSFAFDIRRRENPSMKESRLYIGLAAAGLTALAFAFAESESILWLGFKIGGFTYGGLLGVFFYAVFFTRKTEALSDNASGRLPAATGTVAPSTPAGNSLDKIIAGLVLASIPVSLLVTSPGRSADGLFGFAWPWQPDSLFKPWLSWQWGLLTAFLFTLGGSLAGAVLSKAGQKSR